MLQAHVIALIFLFIPSFAFGVAIESAEYQRDDYLTVWADEDGDCQDTRAEVLITKSQIPATLSSDGCRVLKGEWRDLYTGLLYRDPRELVIDHLVPLKEAHDSGADQWAEAQKRAFANDLKNGASLIAVSKEVHASKNGQDPVAWMPPNRKYWCRYVYDWIAIKDTWGLLMDDQEFRGVDAMRRGCEQVPGRYFMQLW